MRLTSSGTYTRSTPVPKMPPGLVQLMEGLAKDVLRSNPTNVFEFCATHMEKLLEIRDGPSSKKPLTLEQKIAKAQEKVRQRAFERQQRFDKEFQNDEKIEPKKQTSDEEDRNPHDTELASSLKAPVHHDQDLSLASEVEISHEAFTDSSLTPRDSNIDETDDIGVSKSSTFSSVSKSTVIDLGNENEKEVIEGSDAPKDESDNNAEPTNETEIGDTLGDKTTEKEIIEPPTEHASNAQENIELSINDSLQEENKECTHNVVIDVDKIAAKDFDKEISIMDDQIFDDNKITLKNESDYAVELRSLNEVNTIIEENARDLVDAVETNLSSNALTFNGAAIDDELVGMSKESVANSTDNTDKVSPNVFDAKSGNTLETVPMFVTVVENDIKSIENTVQHNPGSDALTYNDAAIDDELVGMSNESVANSTDNTDKVSPNVLDAKSDDTLETVPMFVTVVENDIKSIENTVQHNPGSVHFDDINDNSHSLLAVDNHTGNSIPDDDSTLQIFNVEHQLEVSEQKSCVTVKVIEEETSPILQIEENDVPKENISIENELGVAISDSVNEDDVNASKDDATIKHVLLNNEDDGRNFGLHEKNMVKEHEKIINMENPENTNSSSLPRPDSTDNNDNSSITGSDLSKFDEDPSQDYNQNGHNNMDLETAAVTIQKVFRSFLFKSRNSTFEDITNDDVTSLEEDSDKKEEYFAVANLNTDRRPLGITRMDTVLQTVNEEKSLSLSTDDSSTLSSAATTIQAHVRGFLVRNKMNSCKTVSTNSLVNSNEMLDTDTELQKNKTVLNIHIVPEQGNYLSRDESLITSMDLSLDGSPPSSVNLHPLSYDISERRKLLKREDAIQSVSPPSNNSGKLSEDSVKEVLINENDAEKTENEKEDPNPVNEIEISVSPVTAVTIRDSPTEQKDTEIATESRKMSMARTSSDESDVITPFDASPRSLVGDFENSSKLVHSGEFHDVGLPTKVSRSDTTVVRGE